MNPVYAAEVRYQDYVLRTNRSSTIAIILALILLIPALITAVVFFVAVVLLGLDLPPVPVVDQIQTAADAFYVVGSIALMTMNVAHYLVVALISSGLAAMSVHRERRNHTWDLLVLTRMSASQIAFGKIRASLWVLRRDTAIVTILRVGFVTYMLDAIRPIYSEPVVTPLQLALVTLLVVLWTALDMVLAVTTAVATSLLPSARTILLPVALMSRGVILFGGIWWMARTIDTLYRDPGGVHYAVVGFAGVAAFALIAAVSLKIAEFSAQFAHAAPRNLSQAVSQTRIEQQGQSLSNIPTLSQG